MDTKKTYNAEARYGLERIDSCITRMMQSNELAAIRQRLDEGGLPNLRRHLAGMGFIIEKGGVPC